MNDFDFIIIRPLKKGIYIERVQRKRDLVFVRDTMVFNIMRDKLYVGDKNV